MRKELVKKLWKTSEAFKKGFTEKDENGLGQLNDRGVVAAILLIVSLLCFFGWLIGGL